MLFSLAARARGIGARPSVHRGLCSHTQRARNIRARCMWMKYLRCSDETSTNETAYQQQRRVHPPLQGNPYPLTTVPLAFYFPFFLILSPSFFLPSFHLSLSLALFLSRSPCNNPGSPVGDKPRSPLVAPTAAGQSVVSTRVFDWLPVSQQPAARRTSKQHE